VKAISTAQWIRMWMVLMPQSSRQTLGEMS